LCCWFLLFLGRDSVFALFDRRLFFRRIIFVVHTMHCWLFRCKYGRNNMCGMFFGVLLRDDKSICFYWRLCCWFLLFLGRDSVFALFDRQVCNFNCIKLHELCNRDLSRVSWVEFVHCMFRRVLLRDNRSFICFRSMRSWILQRLTSIDLLNLPSRGVFINFVINNLQSMFDWHLFFLSCFRVFKLLGGSLPRINWSNCMSHLSCILLLRHYGAIRSNRLMCSWFLFPKFGNNLYLLCSRHVFRKRCRKLYAVRSWNLPIFE
jgi:hypothetical protein